MFIPFTLRVKNDRKMKDTLNYKKLEIKFNSKPDFDFINYFFRNYSSDSIRIEFNGNTIFVYLRELDFENFKNGIIKSTATTDEHTAKLLNDILQHIESIKSYGLKGQKRVYVDYNKERKVKNRKEKEIIRGQFFYAIEHNFDTKNNEIPDEFKNKIIVGDSEYILKNFPNNSIDLIFTSPPYNFGLEYSSHKDGTVWTEYFSKLFSIFDECIRILKYGGRMVVNVQPLFSDYIPIHHIISNYLMSRKLIWKGEILWDKHNYNCKYTAWGSWKSPSNPYLKYTWEFLEIFCKGDLKHPGESENIDITAEEFKKWVYAKWDIPPESNMKKFGHPAMFPEQLAERVIKLFSFKGDTVLDPFNGVGTTTFIAKKLGRNFVGIDVSEQYCRTAEERLKQLDINATLF